MDHSHSFLRPQARPKSELKEGALFLGLDCSTQGLKAAVVDHSMQVQRFALLRHVLKLGL